MIGPETVVFGIGNSGRSDDGLGWAFLDSIQLESAFRGQAEYRYQLQVEDAAQVSKAERVIFVDAYKGDLSGGFRWAPCKPTEEFEFTTHVLPPRAIMHYCHDLYGKSPRADILMIQGYDWDLHTGLSAQARENLEQALKFFKARELSSPR